MPRSSSHCGHRAHALAVLAAAQPGELAGLHHHPAAGERLRPRHVVVRALRDARQLAEKRVVIGNDDRRDRQAVLARELEVALVAARAPP